MRLGRRAHAHIQLDWMAVHTAEIGTPYVALESRHSPREGREMDYDGDAFISYAHLDNIGLAEGHKGWVASLQRALEIRVGQLLGKPTEIWWDPKLQGNDVFSETLINQLRRVAALVSVVSPRYVKSEWGRKELAAFVKAAQETGGLAVGDKSRIFKVLKTPVPLEEHPPELQPLLGYEFFRTDPETGRVRELNEIFGPDAEREFWLRLDDLAHDVCSLLEILDPDVPPAPDAPASVIYVAETTGDLREARDAIMRDLQQHGHTVLPNRPLPLSAAEYEAAVREDLARARMSIHMIGRTYGLVPEDGRRSILEVQADLAVERACAGPLTRLVWLPPGLEVRDDRQLEFVSRLRQEPRLVRDADLLETPLDDLKTLIAERLKRPAAASPAPAPADASRLAAQLYLLYDQRDAERVVPWQDYLFRCGFEVLHPLFEGDEAEVREYHEENLRICDAVVIVHGVAAESWLRRKLREVQKSAGLGRVKARPEVVICLTAPKTAEKGRFQTHEAAVVPMWDGFTPEPLQALVARLTIGH